MLWGHWLPPAWSRTTGEARGMAWLLQCGGCVLRHAVCVCGGEGGAWHLEGGRLQPHQPLALVNPTTRQCSPTACCCSAYPFLLRLHALQELERAAQLLDCSPRERVAKVAEWRWNERLSLTTPSFRLQEPVLALRACILRVFEMRRQEASLWLQVRPASARRPRG